MTCQYCGMTHTATCPKIRAIEYYPDGTIKRVEFHNPVPNVLSTFPLNPNVSTTTGGHS